MANVNDKKWKVIDYLSYLNGDQQRALVFPRNLVVHGQKIYILFALGGLMGFDMANLLWKKLDRDASEYHSPNGKIRCWLMESEGELVKILQHRDSNKFYLFKLNNSETDWEKLIQNDQDNRSWVLNNRNQMYLQVNNGFSVKESGGGKKIYQLTRNDNNNCNVVEPPDIHIHDLVSGTIQEYKPDQDGIWVDLGFINKMPPSCVSVGVVDWLV
ncbi:hypothetical protein FRX31_003522 [Thalictrum thalictroides]|uniref:Uncharacterized protein n=1 Tax=Thalictrum thalictroides TaxID=46969 RepID=A0A7J6XEQ7_THATH|nr:hypothetical protein FRX31_003522 [Thalictrum thalictroides]